MKKRIITTAAGLLACIISCGNVYAEVFPYKLMIESKNYMEDYLFLTMTEVDFESESCTALQEGIEAWENQRRSAMEEQIAKLKESAAEDAEALGDAFYGYNIFQQMKVSRADDRVLSILENGYEYLGDAAADSYLNAVNFDVATGEILEVADIVKDENVFQREAASCVIEYIQKNYPGEFSDFTEEDLMEYWKQGMKWYMNGSGIVTVLEESLLGNMTAEGVEIPLTYESFSEHFNEEYTLSEKVGLYEIKENVPVIFETEEGTCKAEICSEILEYEKEYALAVNGQKKELGTFFYFGNTYFLKNSDGKNYILYAADSSSGEYKTYLYLIDGDRVTKTDEILGAIDSANSTPDAIMTGAYLSVLGNYQASKSHYVDEKGKFAAEDELYWVNGNLEERAVLVTKADLAAVADGKEMVIPAGSSLKLLATDNLSKALVLIMDTETRAELTIKKGENGEYWNNTVGGLLETECIETLPYIG